MNSFLQNRSFGATALENSRSFGEQPEQRRATTLGNSFGNFGQLSGLTSFKIPWGSNFCILGIVGIFYVFFGISLNLLTYILKKMCILLRF